MEMEKTVKNINFLHITGLFQPVTNKNIILAACNDGTKNEYKIQQRSELSDIHRVPGI